MPGLIRCAGCKFPRKLLNQLLQVVGLSWDSQVSFNKLMQIMCLVRPASSFMFYDKDCNGSLTREEVKRIVKEMADSEVAHRGRKARATLKLAVS